MFDVNEVAAYIASSRNAGWLHSTMRACQMRLAEIGDTGGFGPPPPVEPERAVLPLTPMPAPDERASAVVPEVPVSVEDIVNTVAGQLRDRITEVATAQASPPGEGEDDQADGEGESHAEVEGAAPT